VAVKESSVYLNNKQVFPTPDSPIIRSLKRWSYFDAIKIKLIKIIKY